MNRLAAAYESQKPLAAAVAAATGKRVEVAQSRVDKTLLRNAL